MKQTTLLILAFIFSLGVILTFTSCEKDDIRQPKCGTVTEKITRPGALILRVKFEDGTEALRDNTQRGQYFDAIKVGEQDCE